MPLPPARPGGAAGPAPVVQRKPPSDPNIFTYEDAEGYVWSRSNDPKDQDQWYMTLPVSGKKFFWDEEICEAYSAAKARAGAKFTLTFEQYVERALGKRESEALARIPIDLDDEAQVGQLYGSATIIDPVERVAAIKKLFTDAGYQVGATDVSTTSSSSTPPHLFDVVGHPLIAKFEVHPGGGIHKASYVRISTQKGMVKVINSKSVPAYDKLGEKARYVVVSV